MKYKPSDKVRIKSLDWYNKNKDEDGIVELSTHVFVPGMSQFCGKVVTIEDVFEDIDDNVIYYMEEIDYDWTDEMIEGLVEENINIDVVVKETTKDISDKVVDTIMGGLMVGKSFNLPEGYQFTDENGNVINATKIVLEKKKKAYPKTYEECCKVMNYCCNPVATKTTHKEELIRRFQFLLLYRDAYWKIAGEEMGLGKPWSPTDSPYVYCIYAYKGEIFCDTPSIDCVLMFPTEEMRDAFYENFKELIEQCKELL